VTERAGLVRQVHCLLQFERAPLGAMHAPQPCHGSYLAIKEPCQPPSNASGTVPFFRRKGLERHATVAVLTVQALPIESGSVGHWASYAWGARSCEGGNNHP
jgi:hypothetical protein